MVLWNNSPSGVKAVAQKLPMVLVCMICMGTFLSGHQTGGVLAQCESMNPWNSSVSSFRVMRGGSYFNFPEQPSGLFPL